MEGSFERFLQEQVQVDPVKVAINRARLDISAGLDRDNPLHVLRTDPIYQLHRANIGGETKRQTQAYVKIVSNERVPLTYEHCVGNDVYTDLVMRHKRKMKENTPLRTDKVHHLTPTTYKVSIPDDLLTFRGQTSISDQKALKDFRAKQLEGEFQMYKTLEDRGVNPDEVVGGVTETPVERLLGRHVARDSVTPKPASPPALQTATPSTVNTPKTPQSVTKLASRLNNAYKNNDGKKVLNEFIHASHIDVKRKLGKKGEHSKSDMAKAIAYYLRDNHLGIDALLPQSLLSSSAARSPSQRLMSGHDDHTQSRQNLRDIWPISGSRTLMTDTQTGLTVRQARQSGLFG